MSIAALLRSLDIDRDSYRVVGLLPLVFVAWADGAVQRAERRAIMRLAREKGWLAGGGAAVLERWLTTPPDEAQVTIACRLLDELTRETRGVGAVLHPSDVKPILRACLDVAEAAGGHFGLRDPISPEESDALAHVAAALGVGDSETWRAAMDDPPSGPADPPGPRGAPFVGAALELLRDPLGMLARGRREYGDVFKIRLGGLDVVLVSHPEHAQRVLVDAADNYERGEPFDPVRELGGENLVTAEGDVWRRLRRIAQPAFTDDALGRLHDRLVGLTRDTLAAWEPHVDRGEPIDVDVEMGRLTLRIMGTLLCGEDLSDAASEIGGAVREVMTYVAEVHSPFRLPLVVPTPANVRVKQARRRFHALVDDIIATRRRAGTKDADDLLSMLMAATDVETGDALGDEELRAEVLNFIIAGHETTALALTWTLYLLSLHPHAARRLQAEIDNVVHDLPPSRAHLDRLEYLSRVVQESLRLYPPAHAMPRRAVSADLIGGYRIRPGDTVVVAIWLLHHNPDVWPNPEGFDPDRFLPDAESARHRFAFIPFAAGPHKCIGMPLAMMEAKIILPMILQRFRLDVLPGSRVEPLPRTTLRPSGPLPMRVVARR